MRAKPAKSELPKEVQRAADRAGAVALQQYVGERFGGSGASPDIPLNVVKGNIGGWPLEKKSQSEEIHDEDNHPHERSTGVDRKGRCGDCFAVRGTGAEGSGEEEDFFEEEG
jgi:hypothetical protein